MPTSSTQQIEPVAVRLSAKVRNAVDAIREPFGTFVAEYSALAVRREELAPRFMKSFGLWQAETGATFVDFVRVLVPDLGTSRKEYRAHRAYQAADYLRRLAAAVTRAPLSASEAAAEVQARTRPAKPSEGLARVLASMLALLDPAAQAIVWIAVHDGLHWGDRQVADLQTAVQDAQPLVKLTAPRGQHLPTLRAVAVVEEETTTTKRAA